MRIINLAVLALAPLCVLAQSNPVPYITQPLSPPTVRPGSASFTLGVNGTGFLPTSVVDLNDMPRATRYVSATRLTATIMPTDVAKPSAPAVSVVNPSPGGGRSNSVLLEVASARTGISFGQLFLSDSAVPYFVSVADVNKDGKLDLVVTEASANIISIYLGNGNGTFQHPTTYPVGQVPISLAIADLDGDGNVDLVVADQNSDQISVLLGNGDGTFQAEISNPTGQEPYTVAAGDLNGDGKVDLATANNSGHSASILVGNGDGTFQPHYDYTFGSGYPLSLVVADVNRDGLPDMVIALNTDSLAVLLQTTVVLKPPLLAFGSQPVGTSSSPQPVTLTNTSSLALKVSGIAISGSDAGDFSENNTCTTVASGGACTINVTFTPQASGNRGATLSITDTAPNSPQVVLLTGTGTVAGATLSPASLTFANQVVSTTSPPQTVTLTNTGNVPLSITSIATTGNFSQTNTCGAGLAAGANCPISVTFTPLATGALTGMLSVTDSASVSPQTASLSGTGTYVSLNPGSLNFGSQRVGTKSSGRSITLANMGTASLMISGVSITGADTGDFAQQNNCGNSVAAGASCTITVTFAPAAKGARTADVSIADSGGGSPQLVPLTGTGT